MKKTKRWLSLLLAAGMIASLAACGGKPTESTAPTAGSSDQPGTPAAEAVYRQLYSSEVTTFNYLYTGNTNDFQMSANEVDSLVEFDSYGVMVPSLAESWESNDDNTVWTFHIRPGVKWVDYQGNEVADVTAEDWVTAAKYINTAANEASLQYMYDGFVKNASAYYAWTAYQLALETAVDGTDEAGNPAKLDADGNVIEPCEEVSFDDVGVKAQDSLTLVYTTEAPCPYFPTVLSYSSYLPVYAPFLEEKGEAFGAATGPDTILYNGAFLMDSFSPQDHRTLVKNPTYWDKDHVYIDRMEFRYNATADTLGPEQFVRGEVDMTGLNSSILTSWLQDDTKYPMVSPSRPGIDYSYFYCFNFEPTFDASLEPDNWILAVNNENFRQSLRHGLDRVNSLAVLDPQNPQNLVNNTVTPATFTSCDGTDYTQFPALKDITAGDSYDEAAALEFKKAAVEELTAAGCTFPVKVYMRYNPSTTNWDKECQVLEQQMENLLGTDYIDIIVEAGPSTGFLGAVRRAGDYGFMKCNWGADYADPQTWTDPFFASSGNNSYNKMYTSEGFERKSEDTKAIIAEYDAAVRRAKEITTDVNARYTAFAEAEALLIDHAIIIPYSISFEGYKATKLNPFEGEYAPYGLALQRFKHQHVSDKALSMDEYNALESAWETERTAALAKAGQ